MSRVARHSQLSRAQLEFLRLEVERLAEQHGVRVAGMSITGRVANKGPMASRVRSRHRKRARAPKTARRGTAAG